MGNAYRNNIRIKNNFFNFVSFLRTVIIIAAIIGGIYYAVTKTDILSKVQSKTQESFEQIVGNNYNKIGRVVRQSDKAEINVNEFINAFNGRIYKINLEDTAKINSEIEVFYVYDESGSFIYEVHDLGNGSIGVQKSSGYLKVYDLISE